MNLIPLNKVLIELEVLLIASTCLMAFPGGTYKFLGGGLEAGFQDRSLLFCSFLNPSTFWCLLLLR